MISKSLSLFEIFDMSYEAVYMWETQQFEYVGAISEILHEAIKQFVYITVLH